MLHFWIPACVGITKNQSLRSVIPESRNPENATFKFRNGVTGLLDSQSPYWLPDWYDKWQEVPRSYPLG